MSHDRFMSGMTFMSQDGSDYLGICTQDSQPNFNFLGESQPETQSDLKLSKVSIFI